MLLLLERDDVTGAVNLAAPNPLPYSEFMRALRAAAGRGFGLPATRWMNRKKAPMATKTIKKNPSIATGSRGVGIMACFR